MAKTIRPYTLDQQLLLPPDLRAWLPDGHLALFVSDVFDALDLAAIRRVYNAADPRGGVPFHPAMLVKLLAYSPLHRHAVVATHRCPLSQRFPRCCSTFDASAHSSPSGSRCSSEMEACS